MPPPKQAKKKKGFSLTPEKKKLLKQLIMQKAAEELKKQQEREAEEKKKAVESRVPKLNIDGLDKNGLEKTVKDLYAAVCRLEEDKYEWEGRLGRQTQEINELNIKVNDVKGKFSKPMLKKVSKTQLTKFDKEAVRNKIAVAATLRSTGQSKFAMDNKEVEEKKPDWGKDQLKQHKESVGENEEKEEEEEEEEDEEEEEEEEE